MTEKQLGIKKKYGYSMIFSEKSYYKRTKHAFNSIFCMLSEYKAIAKTTQCSKVIRLFWYSINDYFSNEQIKK